MVCSDSPPKGLFGHIWVMGGRSLPEKLFSHYHGPVKDFGSIFLGFGGVWVRVHPPTNPTPHPHVLRFLGPHTPRFINLEWSASRKESVGCRLGSVGCQVRVRWGSVFDHNLGQVRLFLPQGWGQNPGIGANQGEEWIQHPPGRWVVPTLLPI